jgi:transposase
MVTLGVDAHKRSHTVVAVDEHGRRLATLTVKATDAGHLRALDWARELEGERRWAIEDCRHLSRRLLTDLLRAGERVTCVPPKLMAGARRSARERGKSDPIDAEAVARALLREPDLPQAHLEGEARDLRLIVDHREDLVAERTRIQNRLRWHLHELFPGFDIPAGAMSRTVWLNRVDAKLRGCEGVVAEIARELVIRCRDLTRDADRLEREIASKTTKLTPSLLAVPGCGPLTAAKIFGETADVRRFTSKAAYAMHTGTAPVPVWSGATERFRLNRGGNRQLNCALHRIAVTQIRSYEPAKIYLSRRMSGGDTKTEAIRALRRRLSDVVYRHLVQDQNIQPNQIPCTSTAA